MEREMAAKRGREAARAGAGGGLADGGGRKDAPWLQTGIVVKVGAAEPWLSALRPRACACLLFGLLRDVATRFSSNVGVT